MNPEQLKDVRPPVDFPPNYLVMVMVGLMLLVAVGYFLRRYWRKRSPRHTRPLTPWDVAYDRLEGLRKNNLIGQARIQEYYTELSSIVRCYMEDRFGIRAPEMTTQEFLWSLKDSADLATAHKEFLRDFLESCDLVKFAKHGPLPEEIKESYYKAKRLVDETKVVQVSV